MFATQIADSIPHASLTSLDTLARDLWRAYAGGALDDPDVEALSSAIEGRRRTLRNRAGERPDPTSRPLGGAPSRFPPRRKQVSPDRARSRERRRRLAASGPLPPALAAKFTTGEIAVLTIVASEVREHGVCDRSYDEIAARAGCCRSLARRAIRIAARMQIVSIELRPRPGRKHLTNLVRILDPAWLIWIGGRNQTSTDSGFRKRGRNEAPAPRWHRPEGRQITEEVAEAPEPRWRWRASYPKCAGLRRC